MPFSVIPAKAGIQLFQDVLDPGACPGPDPGFAGVTLQETFYEIIIFSICLAGIMASRKICLFSSIRRRWDWKGYTLPASRRSVSCRVDGGWQVLKGVMQAQESQLFIPQSLGLLKPSMETRHCVDGFFYSGARCGVDPG